MSRERRRKTVPVTEAVPPEPATEETEPIGEDVPDGRHFGDVEIPVWDAPWDTPIWAGMVTEFGNVRRPTGVVPVRTRVAAHAAVETEAPAWDGVRAQLGVS